MDDNNIAVRSRSGVASGVLTYPNEITQYSMKDFLRVAGPFDITELQQERDIRAEQQANLNNALNSIECLQSRITELQKLLDRKDLNIESLEDQLDDANVELSRIQNQARDIELQQEALSAFNESMTNLQVYLNTGLLPEVLELLQLDDDIYKDYWDDVTGYFEATFIPLFLSSVYSETIQAATDSAQLLSNITGTFKYARTIATQREGFLTPRTDTILTFENIQYKVSDQAYDVVRFEISDQERKDYFLRNAFINFALKLSSFGITQYQYLAPEKQSQDEGRAATRGSLYEAITILHNKVLEEANVPAINTIQTERI